MKSAVQSIILLVLLSVSACGQNQSLPETGFDTNPKTLDMNKPGLEVATLGGGCFWCVEAVFQDLIGVYKVESGYSGGGNPNPNYRDVSSGTTGHAEVVQVHFDPQEISFEEILEVFWSTHDPTTLNRQGYDEGTQYRSVIFFHSAEQKALADKSIKEVAQELWDAPVVTEISPFDAFYPAESYHQNYYSLNASQPYCRAVISPKMAKFRKKFEAKLKPGSTEQDK